MSIALKRRYIKGFRLSREKIKPLCRAEKPPFQFHEKPPCLAPPAFRTQHLYYQTERILSKRNAENELLPKASILFIITDTSPLFRSVTQSTTTGSNTPHTVFLLQLAFFVNERPLKMPIYNGFLF
jgi:hypothetical protein